LRKIILILIFGIFIGSCSVTKKIGKKVSGNSNKLLSGNFIESVKNQNLTDSSFFIQKVEIEVITDIGKEKFIGNVKFEYPDKYLISLKSRSGIEGARIFISKDTILVNDRINKKMYFGTAVYLKKNYGLTQSCLPLIFGDIVLDKNYEDDAEKCTEGKFNINCIVNGVKLNYDIDCQKRKVVLVNQMNNFVQQDIRIKYNNFFNIGDILIPKIVEIEDSQYNTNIKVRILKVEFPWKGTVKFIPGKGYELIELL
jgi:hypothetical protein